MQKIKGVFPGSKRYTHEVVIRAAGRAYGLHLLNGINSARIIPPARQAPPAKLEQASFHAGRGAEVWVPNANNVYDTLNAWDATPNKLHPTLLQRWFTGLRDAEMNMPDLGKNHTWVPLYAGSGNDANRRYLDVSFSASASSNRERAFIILRRRGTPTGNLTMEWCIDSAGNPSTVQKTITKTTTDAPDWISYTLSFQPASVLAVTSGTTYHIKVYGAANDNMNNCWEILCDSAAAGKKSADNSAWSATTYSPYYRITDADVAQRIYMFPFDGAWYAVTSRLDRGNSKLYIFGDRGQATSGGSTTLTDTGAGQYGGTWTTNMWATYNVRIVRGTGQGQTNAIASNTATVLTVSRTWDINPDATSEYVIYGGAVCKEITGHGLGWVSSKPAYANGIIYFPQNDTVDIRIMNLNYANANDHGFDVEDVKHNRAWYLITSYDTSLGPIMVRANEVDTASGSPNGKAISIGKAPTSPSGTPVVFGTDLTFQTSILTGDKTYRITGLYDKNNTVYVAKEDVLYSISGNVPVKITYGADASPNIRNGVAACTGADGNFYLAAEHDVFLISGGGAYPLNMNFNLSSSRAGYVTDVCSEKGWLFAAVDIGSSTTAYSSVMRMTLQNRTWHEQIRGFSAGRRIRSVAWLNWEERRPMLAWEIHGELMFQAMPFYGVRPIQDIGSLFQHEAVVEFPTIDLLNTDPKFFHYLELVTKGLASANNTAVYGRSVELDYQLNNNIAGSTWVRAGSFGISPRARVDLNLGSQYKIRLRLRIMNDDVDDPPVVENFSLSLFTRHKEYASIMLDINGLQDDQISGEELYDWLVERIATADVVEVESIFSFLHNKRMILPAEPNANITSLDPKLGFGAVLNLFMQYLPEDG